MRRSALWFYWEKICSIQYLHFSFEKQVPSQVLKDFSVENLETTLSPFLSKLSSDIHLSPNINYWGSIFVIPNVRSVQCGLCSIHIFFLSFFLLFFLPVFSLTDTNDSRDYREGRGGFFISLIFRFHPLKNIHQVHRDFYHFCLVSI